MTRLPRGLSGRDCERALLRLGFRFLRQAGSHRILRRDAPFAQVAVPAHAALGPGLLRAILRDAGITVDDLLRNL